jgi:hypothetical protein
VTPLIIKALCDHLSENPSRYLDEVAIFVWDEFRTLVTTSIIRRVLVAKNYPKRALSSKLGSVMPICRSGICLIYEAFSRNGWLTWINPDVIKEMESGGQAGHHLVCPL